MQYSQEMPQPVSSFCQVLSFTSIVHWRDLRSRYYLSFTPESPDVAEKAAQVQRAFTYTVNTEYTQRRGG